MFLTLTLRSNRIQSLKGLHRVAKIRDLKLEFFGKGGVNRYRHFDVFRAQTNIQQNTYFYIYFYIEIVETNHKYFTVF